MQIWERSSQKKVVGGSKTGEVWLKREWKRNKQAQRNSTDENSFKRFQLLEVGRGVQRSSFFVEIRVTEASLNVDVKDQYTERCF